MKSSPPVFISTSTTNVPSIPEIKIDSTIDNLLHKGYLVENRVCANSSLIYLMAKTRLGDQVLIKIDIPQYSSSRPSSSDIQVDPSLIPPKINLIPDTAFVCNHTMCISENENFNLISENISKFNNSIIFYPVMLLSDILTDPVKSEQLIAISSEKIAKAASSQLHGYTQEFDQITNDITELSAAYDKIKDISPDTLSDSDQADYYAIQRTLFTLKDTRANLLNSAANKFLV